MRAGLVKNISLAETQNAIHDVHICHKALRIISHDEYICPLGLKGLMAL